MKKVVLVCMILSIVSCTRSLWKVGKCKEYKKFLYDNWIHGSGGVYHFKDKPKYWHHDIYPIYVREECLMGISKDEVVKGFGNPTKTYSNPTVDLYIYCLDSLCLKTPIYGGPALYFEFKNGKVSGVFTDPASSDIPD
jgi:hypothetical protein